MRKKKGLKVVVAVTLCLALLGGTFYFAGGKDAMKSKADSYSQEKGAAKDRQGLLSIISGLIGGGKNTNDSSSGDSSANGQDATDAAKDQLNKNGLGSLIGKLSDNGIVKIIDLISGGKIGKIKGLINFATNLINGNKSVSASNDYVVSDVRKLSDPNGKERYAVAYSDKADDTPYGYAVLEYDDNTDQFVVAEQNIRQGQRNAYATK